MVTTVENILSTMRKGSITLGWDAIVAFSRDKCNRLLALQYLASIANQKPNIIHGAIINDEANQYELSDLVLGIPLLSFANGSLEHSTATLIMPFISGRLDSYVKLDDEPRHLKSSSLITEGAQYTLTITIMLQGGVTGGSDKENIFINLTEAGLIFTTNFNEGTKANQVIGSWFKTQFSRADLPFNRINLGRLTSVTDSPLNPRQFLLATQPASSSAEGAILAFIQTQSPNTGSKPTDGSGFPLLIPDEKSDSGDHVYGSTLIISDAVIFRDFIKPAVAKLPAASNTVLEKPSGRLFSQVSTSTCFTGTAARAEWEQALNGSVPLIRLKHAAVTKSGNAEQTHVPMHTIIYRSENDKLQVSCNISINVPVFIDSRCLSGMCGSWEGSRYGHITVALNLDVNYSLAANPVTMTLSLNKNGDPQVSMNITGDSFVWDLGGNSAHSRSLTSQVQAAVAEPIKQLAVTFNKFEVFPTANLLFPEQNAFKMISAHMPGDIVVFGQLDSNSTAIEISPLTQFTSPGKTCQFTLSSAGSTSWKVLNIDGKTPGLGSISTSGLYAPPSAANLIQAATQELIVASRGSVTAKAMVTVMASSVIIDPVFYYINTSATPLTLSATPLSNNDSITWSIASGNAGGRVSGSNRTAVYTPPSSMLVPAYAVDVIAATNTTTQKIAYCPVLNFKKPTGFSGRVRILPDEDVLLKPSQQVVITIGNESLDSKSKHGPISFNMVSGGILDDTLAETRAESPFTILYGGGTLSDNSDDDVSKATYTAPATIITPCVIISFYEQVQIPSIGLVKSYGYKILSFSPVG